MTMSPSQEHAALLLASGKRHKDVASEVSVTPATICNWQRTLEFNVAVNRNIAIILGKTRDRLIGLSSNSVDALSELLGSENERVRLDACKLILSANGLIGDSERSMLRYGWGIGPVTLGEAKGAEIRRKQMEALSGGNIGV